MEYKFRAWSIGKQDWVYFGITNVPEWVHEAEVEQYIGLHDKNGKEIYLGDTVKTGWQGEVKGYVVFEGYSYLVKDSNNKNLYFNHPERYEVIGNIHNKEEST